MKRWAYLLAAMMMASILVPSVALAGASGRQNTAVGLTAATVAAWARTNGSTGRRNTALALTGASAVAWYRQHQAATSEARMKGYRAGYRAGHRTRYHTNHGKHYAYGRRCHR